MNAISAAKRAKVDCDELPLDLSFKTLSAATILPNDVDQCDTNIANSHQFEQQAHRTYLLDIPSILPDIPSKLLAIEYDLSKQIERMEFGPPVQYVYNPIDYARAVHSNFLQKYCSTTKKLLFLGMNPGPWGMSQTGIPFGEIRAVVDWLKVSGFIGKPAIEHAERKVVGFSCHRSEISGKRFWKLFKDLCDNADNFFQNSFLRNYCPVALMDAQGRNITPAELKGPVQQELRCACDIALLASIRLLQTDKIVGIGRFAEQRAKNVVKSGGLSTNVFWMPHPSPRSTGNENWSDKALRILRDSNLLQYFSNETHIQSSAIS